MSLKTEIKTESKPEGKVIGASPKNTLILTLTMAENYTWKGVTYHRGTGYEFKSEDAMQLLGLLDAGRNVWKIYQKPKPKPVPKNTIMDATGVSADLPTEGAHGLPIKRLDIGDDSEIQDILNREDNGDVNAVGNVVV